MFTIDCDSNPEREQDRRQFPRTAVERPVKVFNPQSGKYHAGSTCDLSMSGVLIELQRPIAARPGDIVLVGIAEKRRQPLLRQSEMLRANVVRTMHAEDGRMLLAAELPSDADAALNTFRDAA